MTADDDSASSKSLSRLGVDRKSFTGTGAASSTGSNPALSAIFFDAPSGAETGIPGIAGLHRNAAHKRRFAEGLSLTSGAHPAPIQPRIVLTSLWPFREVRIAGFRLP